MEVSEVKDVKNEMQVHGLQLTAEAEGGIWLCIRECAYVPARPGSLYLFFHLLMFHKQTHRLIKPCSTGALPRHEHIHNHAAEEHV